jgi:UDP-2,3-diacylglucosamine pyrophosphatase LpxH
MNVGVITDTHYGSLEEPTTEVIERIVEYFKSQNVEIVIHLGDIAEEPDEEDESEYRHRVRSVTEQLTDFTVYFLRGNHDLEYFTEEEFEDITGIDTCVGTTERITGDNAEILLVNSAKEVEPETYLGFLPKEAISEIVDSICSPTNSYIMSHYPLQYTPFYQERPFFNTRPEYTFPINKALLDYHLDTQSDQIADKSSTELVCGHLHPTEEKQLTSQPRNFSMTIKESTRKFELDNGNPEWIQNDTLELENLVYTI